MIMQNKTFKVRPGFKILPTITLVLAVIMFNSIYFLGHDIGVSFKFFSTIVSILFLILVLLFLTYNTFAEFTDEYVIFINVFHKKKKVMLSNIKDVAFSTSDLIVILKNGKKNRINTGILKKDDIYEFVLLLGSKIS